MPLDKLPQDKIAKIVEEALWHFHEERYRLYAWCIMPNHVHVVLQPIAHNLSDILIGVVIG
jgi:REP element-mobilizing transposase RayT